MLIFIQYFTHDCDTPSAMGYFAVTSKSLIPGSSQRRSLDPSGTTEKKVTMQIISERPKNLINIK